MSEALHPPPSLLAKVGSILTHIEEALSDDGHHYDWAAVRALIECEDVREWLDALGEMALVPVKRRKAPSHD